MSDDDDYMNDALLSKIEDVRPGISASRDAKRQLRIDANREEAIKRERREKPKSREELEKTRLEEGINKPICSESKGFKLLSLMGYKEGMALGRAREGQPTAIKEPIPIQVKSDRSGVGMEEAKLERQKEVCEAHMQAMKKRAMMEEELADDFRTRKRLLNTQKLLVSEIKKLKKACQEMDCRANKEVPIEWWYWPIYASEGAQLDELENDDLEKSAKKKMKIGSEKTAENTEEIVYRYTNGKEAPMPLDLFELGENELREHLSQIVDYMRTAHFYCLWCGCAYSSQDELLNNCPGTTREGHEN